MSADAISLATGPSLPSGKNLVLVGPMGAGKSEVGRRVAARLGRPFIDVDSLVEAKAGMAVAELFRCGGEAAFRQAEAAALASLTPAAERVVATGGGAVLSEANRALLRQLGWVVWLKATPATLARRVAGGARPLLQGKEALAELTRLSAEREGYYAAVADWSVQTDGHHPEGVAARVVAAFRREAGHALGPGPGL